ncbi:NAD(P)-binding domain-containing protein [Isoptericola variabilis]|uniref:NAD(P)-binding domain-containing protein n=1 Tax=Isoptericola variabilis TaxID=139208 RepID=UPI003D2511F7
MSGRAAEATLLGLGHMGRALAGALLDAGHDVAVWNRTSGRDAELVSRGARRAADVRDAVVAAPIVVVCLYGQASVRATLDPVVDDLRGRAVVNLTTTTPAEARELAAWAAGHGVRYLDGAIMFVALDAEAIDSGDYSSPVQSLDWSDLGHLVRASEEQGVDPAPIAMVEELRRRQVDAGHGAEGFARIYESLRRR